MSKSIRLGLLGGSLVDYTSAFTPTGYTVSYIKRRGPNSGDMEDGTHVDDVRATKAVVTCFCMPANETVISNLLTLISETYLQVYFYDPKIKAYRTMIAMPSEPSQRYRGEAASSVEYWTGTVITFTEK